MLSFATVRERWHSFAGGFVVLFLGMTLVSMSALALTSSGPRRCPTACAGTPVFVSAPKIERGDGNFAPDRPWSPAAGHRPARPADRDPRGDDTRSPTGPSTHNRSSKAAPRPSERGYAWSTAMLAPYPLAAGTAPDKGEVVLDRSLGLPARGTGVRADRARPGGLHRVRHGQRARVYLNDTEAARISAGCVPSAWSPSRERTSQRSRRPRKTSQIWWGVRSSIAPEAGRRSVSPDRRTDWPSRQRPPRRAPPHPTDKPSVALTASALAEAPRPDRRNGSRPRPADRVEGGAERARAGQEPASSRSVQADGITGRRSVVLTGTPERGSRGRRADPLDRSPGPHRHGRAVGVRLDPGRGVDLRRRGGASAP